MADSERNMRFVPTVSPEEAIQGFKRLAKSAQKTFDELSLTNPDQQVKKLQSSLAKTVATGEKLKTNLEKASEAKVPTKEYTELAKDIEYAEKQLERLYDQQAKAKKAESMKPIVAEYESLQQKAQIYKTTIDEAIKKHGEESNTVKQLNVEYKDVLTKLENMAPKVELLHQKSASYTAEINNQNQLLVDMKQELQEMVNTGKAFTVDSSGIEAAKNALESNNNQLRLQQEAIASLQQKQSEAASEQAQKIHEQAEAEAELARKMLETYLNAGKMDENLAEVLNRIKEIESELEQLQARQQELEQAGVGLGYEEYDQNLNTIKQLEEELSNLKGRVQEYRDQQANTSAQVDANVQRNAESYRGLGESITSIFNDISQRMYQAANDTEMWQQSVQRVRSTIQTVLGVGKRLLNGISRVGNAIGSTISNFSHRISDLGSRLGTLASRFLHVKKHSDGFNFSLKKAIWTVLKYGVGIRSLYALFRRLRSATTEGIQALAQMDGGMNQTNAAMSQLVSMLNLVKGSLATAFAPILTAAVPMLTSLMQTLANAITYIGMFIAKMTGATSFTKAIFKKTNYAAGAGGGSGSKGKSAQEKYDEAVEKANKKYDKQVKSIDEKNANAAAAAEEKQAKAAEKLAKKQREANKELAHYDQLNVINIENMEELEDIEPKTYEYPELELPKMEDFMDAAGGGGAESPFGTETVSLEGLEWNWDDIKKKAEELGRGLADKLNKFFKDKDFAKKLGHNIAEALNTALHFVYGFVDQLDWLAMGEWLGTLVQTGIEDFEWDLLGKTIGEILNGIADTIIGFFNDYKVGTLGSSIATMLNNAIETVEPDKLGQALADILKAPIIELTQLLTDTNWKLMAEKLSAFFQKVFTSDELNGETLGQSIGNFVNALMDSIIKFFEGWEVGSLGASIAKLINDAIETVDAHNMAQATSTLVNNVAAEIKSFFDTLDVGELTDKISTYINESVKGINAEDVGGAIKSMLKTAIDFVAQLLSKTDFYAIGEKFGEIIKEIFGDEEGDGDLSDAAGKMIAGIINAGANLITGIFDSGAIDTLTKFILDSIITAIKNIDLAKVIEALKDVLDFASFGIAGSGGPNLSNMLGVQDLIDETNRLKQALDEGKISVEQYNTAIKSLTETGQSGLDEMLQKTESVTTATETAKTKTEEYNQTAEGLSTTAEAVEQITTKTDALKTKTDEIGVTTSTVTKTMQENYSGVGTQVEATTGVISKSINDVTTKTETSKTNVEGYSNDTVESLGKVKTKFTELTTDFSALTTTVESSLNSITDTIGTWYEGIVTQYFSYEVWSTMMNEGPVQAITDFFTNDFGSNWDTNMTNWWNNKVKPWFAKAKWDTDIFTPLKTNIQTHWTNFISWWDDESKNWWTDKLKSWFENGKWDEDIFSPLQENIQTHWQQLMTWWDTQMSAWWTGKVTPWFLKALWDAEFKNISDAADDAFEVVESSIKSHIGDAKTAVKDACEDMKSAIEEVMTAMQNLENGNYGGGGGSGSSSGFGGSGGGGGGPYGFMPRLEVMHFEDNLGMSAFKFPELAKGAVIPPNNRFLAVLGDQRSGKNIEAPLNTIVDAFNMALNQRDSSIREPIVLQLDSEVIAEAVWDEQDKRYKQRGDYMPGFN